MSQAVTPMESYRSPTFYSLAREKIMFYSDFSLHFGKAILHDPRLRSLDKRACRIKFDPNCQRSNVVECMSAGIEYSSLTFVG